MPALIPAQIHKIAKDIEERENAIQDLTSKPFNIEDKKQLGALNDYLKHFEYTVHRMFLFQAMAELNKVWAGSWLIKWLLPIPEFLDSLLNYGFYIGLAGLLLENFSMRNFYQELLEMQTLYNWAMKEGRPDYQYHLDNTAKMATPEIQSLMQLIAPFSDADFMIAWAKITDSDEENTISWFTPFSNAYSAGASFFNKPTDKDPSNAEKIRDLKTQIEKQDMQVGVMEGLKRAGNYFSYSPNFREIAMSEVVRFCQAPLQMLKEAAPSMLNAAQSMAANQAHPHAL